MCTVGGNVNWYSHYGGCIKIKKKKKEEEELMIPYDPEISLLSIYLKKIYKNTCTSTFIVAFFTIAKI